MIITINADWRLASDPLQWTLQKQKLVKGEERWRSLAFFGDLDYPKLAMPAPSVNSMVATWPVSDNRERAVLI